MGKKEIYLLLGILLILTVPQAKACIEPENRGEITQDTILCEGEFYLDYGLEVISDNTVIKCNDTTIKVDAIEPNEEGFKIENRENITIKNCVIHGFQFGVLIGNSKNITLVNNTFNENTFGIYFRESFLNTIKNNSFHDNGEGINIGEESRGNVFEFNTFNQSGFNFNEHNERPNNTYLNNEYINTDDIGNHQTEYKYEEEQETTNDEEEEDEPGEETRTITREGSKNPQEILQMVYEAKDLDDKNFQEDVRKMNETLEKVEIKKVIHANYKKNTTQVNTTIKVKENLGPVQIFEYVQKSLAKNASDHIKFHTDNYEILRENPLIMWEFSDVKQGDEIETSYTTTRAIEEDEEEPITTVCVDCAKERPRYRFLIPLILVPLIIIGFIIFERYHHKPENLK
ncbi:MAG: NosD domain-containing protein [Candidatus Nanoarchaeia archaeon]